MAKLLAVCLIGLFGGASAAACEPANQCPQLSDGDYCPVNDVMAHADINKDVKEIATLLKADDYAGAKDVYVNGMHSAKGDSKRTLQSMAKKDMNKGNKIQNTWYNGYVDLYGSYEAVWDPFILECFDGTGVCAGQDDAFRDYIINKCLIGIVTGYAVYEMGSGILDKAASGKTEDTGAAYAWDEAAAFHIGNLPCENTGATATAKCSLYSPYEFSWKRDLDFPDGTNVHTAVVKLFNFGLLNLRGADYNEANALAAQSEIYKLYAITAIRSAIKYSAKMADDHKYLAEGWAYWRSASGYISSISAATKATVQEIDALFDLSQGPVDASVHCQVKEKVESMYTALGIDCSMVGTWKDEPVGDGSCATCSGPASGATPLHSGSTEYVDMCQAATDGDGDVSSAWHPVQIVFLGAALSLLSAIGF